MNDNDAILRVTGLTKRFSGVLALDDVSLEVRRGEIHALCGENGAGKSTLIKMISGAISPTEGTIEFEGETYEALTPRQAISLGISSVYQDFSLIPYLSVAENVFLGEEKTRGIFLNKEKMIDATRLLCEELQIELNVKKRVGELSVAYKQIVEIIKAVSRNSKLIILDEPTASLTVNETKIFFRLIARLKQNNITVLFISHRLEEVFELCDRVTVLCDGKKTTTQNTRDMNRAQLISCMVGREIKDDYPRPKGVPVEQLFRVDHLVTGSLHDISFNVRKGEIVGFGGLVGSGRSELAEAIFGADKIDSGVITFKGENYAPRSPRHALSKGIGLIPEDRKIQGSVQNLSVRYNQTIGVLGKCRQGLRISRAKENAISDKYIQGLRIKTPSKEQVMRNLSGGNQQKVVVSKILACECDLIIFDEPTRGIDVNAKQEIYQIMRDLAEEGKSIIMISSDMPELIGMSQRIYVMSNGYCVGELEREQFSQETILEMASSKL